MNKNPFLPTPSFTPQQPPLPPGPPPAQSGQPDYSAWWPGAQTHQPHVQPPVVGTYNPQWTAPQPPRPAEQSALYANYGYGSQNNWQRQQQQQQQQQQPYHPSQIIQQPPPPPAQTAYNPYQSAAAYAQPYVPQPGPPPQTMVQPGYPHPPPQPQQIFAPQMAQHQPPHQQPTQPRHHASPQHLPPAKRQRFDGPNNHNRHHHNQQHHQQPPQPQFQPPPAPPHNAGSFSGPGRGGLPSGPGNRGGIPSGPGGRGGGAGGRSGRGSSTSAGNRGGLSGGRGRGGSFVGGGGRGPTGPGGNQPHGPARGQGSRNFGNKDFNNRRGGGSFNVGSGNAGYSHQGPFRGRNQGHAGSSRGGRNDGGGGSTLASRESTMASGFGSKKDENRRTLTDFKIVGLSIPDLGWTWGTIPSSPVKTEETGDTADGPGIPEIPVKKENLEDEKPSLPAGSEAEGDQAEVKTEPVQDSPSKEVETAVAKPAQDANANLPPSRIRIYFHTPVTADDSRPIPHNASYGEVPSDTRKGKRKKTEDDDGDVDERRAPPPPPQMGIANDDRSSVAASVAPSVAETASEADWLMAAIVEGEEEAEAANVLHPGEEDDQDASHDGHDAEHDMVEGGDEDAPHEVDETLFDGTSHDDDDMTMTEGAEPDDIGSTAVDVGAASGISTQVAQSLPLNVAGSATDSEFRTNGAVAHEQHMSDVGTAPQDAAVSVVAPSSQSDALQFQPAADGSANHSVSIEAQVSQESSRQYQASSLQSISTEPTLLDIETQVATQPDDGGPDMANGDSTQIVQPEHLPEPPASPSTIAHDDTSSAPVTNANSKADKTPSANRLSISYARGNRRLVVDAEVVDGLKLYRQEGRIEVSIKITKDKHETLKGVLMEELSEVTKSYSPLLDAKGGSVESDPTVPPFWRTTSPSTIQLLVYLDTARPLSEPKWAKTGDTQEWLKSMFGRMFWVAGDAAEGWEKKIQVTDPDPPPTIWTVLGGWVTNSPVGQLNERQRFLKTHMTDIDNILEILLRLVRGERATAFSQSTPTISAPSVSGPLLSAFQESAHGAQQTHVSLAVLAMFRLTTEYATKASGDKGKVEAEERVGEIIRYLPSHLIYKSLDGIFKEWRVDKKGR